MHRTLRLLMLFPAGYLLMVGFAAFVGTVVPPAFLLRGEAVLLGIMLGFPLFAASVVWGFLQPRGGPAVAKMVVAGAALLAAAAVLAGPFLPWSQH